MGMSEFLEQEQTVAQQFEQVARQLDEMECAITEHLDPKECPSFHHFTPHLYCRETHLPAGTLLTSKTHMTEHPFVISQGAITVWTERQGVETLQAPYFGITKPGTKRLLFANTDTIWTTMHVTDKTDVDEIEKDIIFKRVNPLLHMNSNQKVRV